MSTAQCGEPPPPTNLCRARPAQKRAPALFYEIKKRIFESKPLRPNHGIHQRQRSNRLKF